MFLMVMVYKMSQQEVLDVLRDNPKRWLTSKEIVMMLEDGTYGNVTTSLKKLRKNTDYILCERRKSNVSKQNRTVLYYQYYENGGD